MATTGASRGRTASSTFHATAPPAASFWTPLLVTGASIFLFTLDAGLMSVSLPDVEAGFPDASRATISWVATGQGVAIVSLMLVAGRFADRNGRRRVFRLGMVLFGIGAVVTGAAQEPMLLIAGRVLQGIGGALFNAVALAMALREVPDHRRAEAVGFWGTIGSVGAILGPTGGALLVDAWGWRAVFLATAPLSLITAAVAGRTLRESADPDDAGPVPLLDVVLVAIGVGSVATALSQSGRWGWSSTPTLGLLLGGSALLAVVVGRARRPGAIIDLRLFGNRTYSVATLAASIQQFGFLPWFVSIPFVLRGVWGWSALQTGFAMSLGMVVSAFTGLLGGRIADRFGYVGVTALCGVIAGIGPLWWVVTMDADPDFWGAYLPGIVIYTFGSGVAGMLPTGAALARVPASLLGSANATLSTLRRLTAAIGLAVMPGLLGEGSGESLLEGAKKVWIMVAVVHLAVAPLMIWYGRELAAADAATNP